MRVAVLIALAGTSLLAQSPILYTHGVYNAASYAPFGLPNAAIARGSVFTIFGENLGPAQSPSLSFPLSSTLGGVSISVTQNGVTTLCFPLYVSASQINAILPSTVTAGLATLRLMYQSKKSNAVTIQIGDSAPGVFAVSSGGYGPGAIQNFVTASNQPINSLAQSASRGQAVTIWGTGLGPVTFPDNVAPTTGNVAAPVTVNIGGQRSNVLYSGRSPCCAGVDQIVAEVPDKAPLGCWVPVSVNAGGVVSNTATIAIAGQGAASCDDPGNPLSKLVRTAGTQAYIDLERVESVENLVTSPASLKTLDKIYTRFYSRPDSPFNFDPYMSYPPAGTCLVHQTSGDAFYDKSLRGTLPTSASINPQPKEAYNNGTQLFTVSPPASSYWSVLGGTIDSKPIAMSLAGAGASFTVDPGGANEVKIPLKLEQPPSWTRPTGILTIPRNAPFTLNFTPGDSAAPTAILIYSYSAATNSTVEVQCLAPPGATAFTISAATLANLPPTYGLIDGSYVNLLIGTLGINNATAFSNALAANGLLLNSSWLSQSVVIQ